MNRNLNLPQLQWKRMGFAVAVSVLATIVLTALFAALVNAGMVQEDTLVYIAPGIVICASLLGSASAGGRGGLAQNLLVGGLYWVMLLGINALMYDGQLHGILPTLALICGGSIAGWLLMGMPRRSTRYRSRRRHRR